jgi:hypothetical protein
MSAILVTWEHSIQDPAIYYNFNDNAPFGYLNLILAFSESYKGREMCMPRKLNGNECQGTSPKVCVIDIQVIYGKRRTEYSCRGLKL